MIDPSAPPPVETNYLQAHFEQVTIVVSDLFRASVMTSQEPLIQGKTFTNCVIEGPAVLLALSGVSFEACQLGLTSDDPRSLMLMPMAKDRVVGAIAGKDCTFRGCQFFAIGYTGTDAFLDRMLQVLGPQSQKPAADA